TELLIGKLMLGVSDRRGLMAKRRGFDFGERVVRARVLPLDVLSVGDGPRHAHARVMQVRLHLGEVEKSSLSICAGPKRANPSPSSRLTLRATRCRGRPSC